MNIEEMHFAGILMKRHGCWFISATDPTNDSVPEDLFDCASAFPLARRLLVEMSDQFGFEGAVRWELRDNGTWELYRARDTNDDRIEREAWVDTQ